MKVPRLSNKSARQQWLAENKETLIAAKKAEMKRGDAVVFHQLDIADDAVKAYKPIAESEDLGEIKTRLVINTTNLMDMHDDVHFPGLWKKSLRENRNIMHLQEHELKFDHIISDGDDLEAYTQQLSWKDLGQKFDGVTEALIFDSVVKKDRNQFMFDQYRQARIKNHSVGMQYVKIALAVDSDDEYWQEEKKTWNKYIDQVVNRKHAEELGYFFAVTEAKVIEGSAVPLGSNWITPTMDNDLKDSEPPGEGTRILTEPPGEGTLLSSDEIIKRILTF